MKIKQRKLRKEAKQRQVAIRRAIEEHQNKRIKETVSKFSTDGVEPFVSPKVEGLDDLDRPEPGKSNSDTQLSKDSTPELFWVYEPEDLDDFTVDEVKQIWNRRSELCGSKEAAAEALAILEVAEGLVKTYQGWQVYINKPEIVELLVPYLSDDSEHSYIKLIEENALTRDQVLNLNHEDLQAAWDNRPESFSSIEAACQALTLLRNKSGISEISSWQDLLDFPEIKKLKEHLPNEDKLEQTAIHADAMPSGLEFADLRKHASGKLTIREGQSSFRRSVIQNYFGACCITGTSVSDVLEAAHISPYSGAHSNRLDNSLCLRVDIHRLFDRFLLSIEPDSGLVKLGKSLIDDHYYGNLEGVPAVKGKVEASQYLLSQHYRTFFNRNYKTGN